jgi:hypothetical protein
MDLPPFLHEALIDAAPTFVTETAARLGGAKSRAFWQWALCELKIELHDEMWALVPEDLKTDREFMMRVSTYQVYVWDKLGAFAHDLDFLKGMDSKPLWGKIEYGADDVLFDTFAPCYETYDGVMAMLKFHGTEYPHWRLPKDHWCRSDVDVALAWIPLNAGFAFRVFTPHLRNMEVVWKTALKHRTRDTEFAELFPKHVLQTRSYVLQLAEVDPGTLRHAPEFSDDEEAARLAMKADMNAAFETLSHRLQNDRAFLLPLLREASHEELDQFKRYVPKNDLELKAHVARGYARTCKRVPDRTWLRDVVLECLRAVETEQDVARIELYTEVLTTHMTRFPELESKITRAVERVYHPAQWVHTRGDKRAYAEAFGVA